MRYPRRKDRWVTRDTRANFSVTAQKRTRLKMPSVSLARCRCQLMRQREEDRDGVEQPDDDGDQHEHERRVGARLAAAQSGGVRRHWERPCRRADRFRIHAEVNGRRRPSLIAQLRDSSR